MEKKPILFGCYLSETESSQVYISFLSDHLCGSYEWWEDFKRNFYKAKKCNFSWSRYKVVEIEYSIYSFNYYKKITLK